MLVRMLADIDGKGKDGELPFGMTEEEFWAKDRQTGEGLARLMVAAGMSDSIAIATGSEWSADPLKRKISWRGYDGGVCMSLSAQRRFWRDLVLRRGFTTDPTNKHKLLGDGVEFPTCVNLDLSVYEGGRKLRMLGSRKDSKVDGVRTLVGAPLRLVVGKDVDTLVTYIPAHCVEWPAPPDDEKPSATSMRGMPAPVAEPSAQGAASSGAVPSVEGVAALVAAVEANTVRTTSQPRRARDGAVPGQQLCGGDVQFHRVPLEGHCRGHGAPRQRQGHGRRCNEGGLGEHGLRHRTPASTR